MKKKFQHIMVGALCIVMLLSLAACGSSKPLSSPDAGAASSNNSTNRKSDEPIYLSDMLEADGPQIWYEVEEKAIPGKDSTISLVYVFEDGKVTVYNPNNPSNSKIRTLGDVSKLTDDEILEMLMQGYLENDQKIKDDFFEKYESSVLTEEGIYQMLTEEFDKEPLIALERLYVMANLYESTEIAAILPEYETLYNSGAEKSKYEPLLRSCAQIAGVKMNEMATTQIAAFKDMENRRGPSSYDYVLNVLTDSTGNETKSEKIIYSFDSYNEPVQFNFSINGDTSLLSQFALNEEIYTVHEGFFHCNGRYTEGTVYDTNYGGFFNTGNDKIFVTELSESLIISTPDQHKTPMLDTPKTPGVTVD